MNRPISTFALVISAAAGAAFAQVDAYTDVAPYTDRVPAARSSAGAPSYWKGQLSRADVIAATRDAQREGMIAVGDALDYPFLMKVAPNMQLAQPQPPSAQVMGGPSSDVSSDGYRFVGGEAGWIFVGPPGVQR
jgi:hypothetical protein